jgi:hypothetical protein
LKDCKSDLQQVCILVDFHSQMEGPHKYMSALYYNI